MINLYKNILFFGVSLNSQVNFPFYVISKIFFALRNSGTLVILVPLTYIFFKFVLFTYINSL